MSHTPTKPFVLGLDLDNVTGDYVIGLRAFVADKLGIDPAELPDPPSWSFAESWPAAIRDGEHYLELHAEAVAAGLFRDMQLMPGAHERLWDLSDAGVHIRVVTHRLFTNGHHHQSVADTITFLDRPMPDGRQAVPYRDLCFMGHKSQISADVYIDDAPHNVTDLRNAGMHCIVFDAPYNRDVPGPRARNWDEAHDLILARKQLVESDNAA